MTRRRAPRARTARWRHALGARASTATRRAWRASGIRALVRRGVTAERAPLVHREVLLASGDRARRTELLAQVHFVLLIDDRVNDEHRYVLSGGTEQSVKLFVRKGSDAPTLAFHGLSSSGRFCMLSEGGGVMLVRPKTKNMLVCAHSVRLYAFLEIGLPSLAVTVIFTSSRRS
jgi:hypothetical protein